MKVKARFEIVPAGFFALAVSTMATTAWATDPIVGTWRLVSWTDEEIESKVVHKMFGDKPDGLLTLTSDGHMMLIITDQNRKTPTQPTTDAEAVQLYPTMIAYGGRYKTDGDKLIVYPEIDARQMFNGTERVRSFEVTGDRLQYQIVSGTSGKQIVEKFVFDR
jgi:hypothetical protein